MTEARAKGLPDLRDDETGDAVETPPKGWYKWRSERRTSVELGITLERLHETMTELGIESVKIIADNTRRVAPGDFDAIRSYLLEQGASPQDLREGPTAASLRAAQGHAERMFRLFEGPVAAAQVRAEREIDRLSERVVNLEAELDQNRQKNEAIQSEAHFRELATKQMGASEARKAQLVGVLVGKLPKLVDQVTATLTGGRAAGGFDADKLEAAVELLGGLDPKLLEVLPGFLTERQQALLAKITGPTEAPNTGETPDGQTPAAPE